MKAVVFYFALVLFHLLKQNCFAQSNQDILNRIDSLDNKINRMTNNKLVRAGFSIGYRNLHSDMATKYQSASISPIDSTLKLQSMDPNAMVLSTSLVIFPFLNSRFFEDHISKHKDNFKTNGLKNMKSKITYTLAYLIKNGGFQVNINLAEFTEAQQNFSFNKNIEGGIGICLRLTNSISLGFNNEVMFSRQLRDDIKAKENQKMYIDNEIVTDIDQIDVNNENYYITKNLIAYAYRVIILF